MKILIIKTSSLGDILHTLPLLEYLKNKFPAGKIDWVVEKRCSSLLAPISHTISSEDGATDCADSPRLCEKWGSEGHSSINTLLLIDSKNWDFKAVRKKKYDLVFDLQGNCKSALILFFVKAPLKIGFGRKTVAEFPNIFFTNRRFNPTPGKNIREDYLSIAKQFFNDSSPYIPEQLHLKPIRKILVAPGSSWKNKQIPTLQPILEALKEKYNPEFYFIWGTPAEKALVERLSIPSSHLVGTLPIPALRSLMLEMDLVVSMDSFPLHLAASLNIPTLSFFGPSSSQKYAPIGHVAYQGTCPYGITFEKRCPRLRTCKTGACMTNVSSVFK